MASTCLRKWRRSDDDQLKPLPVACRTSGNGIADYPADRRNQISKLSMSRVPPSLAAASATNGSPADASRRSLRRLIAT